MGFRIKLGINEVGTWNFWRALAAECFGCFFFLLCVTTVTIGWGTTTVSANNVEIGIGIGLSIASLAQAFGHVSGGHLNPAVSLGMVLAGRIPIVRGIVYIIAQLLGGIAGAAVTKGCVPDAYQGNLGATLLGKGVAPEQGFALEFLFTFMLVFFVLSITDEKKQQEPYGTTLGIGIIIWVAHVCLIPFTGCGINPTRSFGPAVVMNASIIWNDHWVYWVGPLIGGILAAPIYTFIFYVSEEESLDIADLEMVHKNTNI